MDAGIVILIIISLFIIMLLLGIYIHVILFMTGIAGLVLLDGFSVLEGLVGNQPFNSVASFSLTTIPLFILMAQFIMNANIIQEIFLLIRKLSKGKDWLLGVLTLLVGGLLGAVSGSGAATAASLGQVAVPELEKSGYHPPLAGAIAASAGSLSGIIPPSIILILFGVSTETSIGKLFIGAMIPGILTMLVFIFVILYYYFKYNKGVDKSSDVEAIDLDAKKLIVVILASFFIFITVFGGIYSGIVTPTEAAALGAFVALITAAVLKKLNWAFLVKSLVETVKVSGMVLLIIVSANVFSRFVSLSMLPRTFIDLLNPIIDQTILVLIILILLYFVLFMFIEGGAVVLMTASISLPIIQAIEVDPIWFGVFISLLCTIGLITPPVGLSVYAVSGATNINSTSIFRYAMSFAVVSTVVVCTLLIMFPSLVLWLPGLME